MTDAVSILNLLAAPRAAGTAARPAGGGFVTMVSGRHAAFEQAGEQTGVSGGPADPLGDLVNLLDRLRSRAANLLNAASGADPAPGDRPEGIGDLPPEMQALIATLAKAAAPQATQTARAPVQEAIAALTALLDGPGGAAGAPDMIADPEALQRLGAMLGSQTADADAPADMQAMIAALSGTGAETVARGPAADRSEVLDAVAGLASALAAALARFERDTGAGLIAALKSGQPAPAGGGAATAAPGRGQGAETGGAVAALRLLMSVADRVERGLRALPAANPDAPAGAAAPRADMTLTAIAAAATPMADTLPAGPRAPEPAVQSLLRQIAAAASVSMREPGPAAEGLRDRGARLLAPDDILRALSATDLPGRPTARPDAAPRSAEPAPETPRFAAALTGQIRAADISEGRTRIELSPRGLGSIEVDVRTEADGTLKVVVRAENPAVLNSLRAERDLLAQAIGRADGGDLDFQTFSQQPGSGGDDDRARPEGGGVPEPETAAPAAQPAAAPAIGNGRLDIMT